MLVKTGIVWVSGRGMPGIFGICPFIKNIQELRLVRLRFFIFFIGMITGCGIIVSTN